MDYVREEGKAKPLAQQMGHGEFLLATSFAVLPVIGVIALGMMSWQRIAAGMLLAALATIWLAWRFRRRLGGYRDCLGAVQQLSETAFYLGALASLPSWWNPEPCPCACIWSGIPSRSWTEHLLWSQRYCGRSRDAGAERGATIAAVAGAAP
jgi:hypothetical protein